MDYEKAYTEAIESLKRIYDQADSYGKELMEKEFPELADSDRIRQDLIRFIKNVTCLPSGKYSIQDFLNWLEKQGEQKSADKVELKFHEGEWLCENEPNNYARFIQILETVNVQGKERYRISRNIHNDEDIVEFDFVEKYYHKFDIKDARDGDVLVTKEDNRPFIFKGLLDSNNPNCPVAYCGIDSVNLFLISPGNHWWSDKEVCPATKEQRELLFQKMKEAGYEWDENEKALVMIGTDNDDDDEQYEELMEDNETSIKQNPAWSEEDEERIKQICEDLKCGLENFRSGKSVKGLHFDEIINSNIDWLKSIKPQPHWKPTEEQLQTLKDTINHDATYTRVDVLESLINDLKKL